MNLSFFPSLSLVAAATVSTAFAAPAIKATVQATRPGHEVPRTLYGIFFEDINHAADGGLYPELVANRGFDWPEKDLGAWTKDFRGGGAARISRQMEFPLHQKTATYLRVEVYHPGTGLGTGVSNPGFSGMAVKQGEAYRLSFYARPHANYQGGLRARLEGKDGTLLAEWRLEAKDWKNQQPAATGTSPLDPVALADWVKYETELVPSAAAMDARLSLLLDAPGTVDLEFVSLFPKETWGNRPNGLRKDLVQKLKDMRPGALRFPGGCIVEGVDLDNLYDWKRTVGPIERRPPNWNLWGYWQSHGLGYFEYFQLAEDIGAEALPVLAAGMSCQFRKSEMPPLEGLQEFIQSALDLIEFANGAADTPWGKVRADMGRAEPFNIKYLGIGNENWGREFIDRYEIIYRAVKAKHPEILIVSSSGAGPAGPEYDLAWREIPRIGADLIDEHYYVSQEWLYQSNKRYDHFDRSGPKVYVGEYACHLPGRPNNLHAALAEAHMMTGFERNSDVVVMTSYAPLFNKIGHTQWVPDLIWFDNARSFGTPSYHVQAMFGNHLPDKILPIDFHAQPGNLPPAGRIGIQSWLTTAEFRDIQVTGKDGSVLLTVDPAKGLDGWTKPRQGKWETDGGVFRQTDAAVEHTAISIGDPTWQDYTLTLKARKTGGAEGFIVRVRDQENRYVHVNLGGWGNTAHGIEQNGQNPVQQKPGTIVTGRWYDVRVRLQGEKVSAWLDGQPVFTDVVIPPATGPAVGMVAGLDAKTGEIIVKCVNPVEYATEVDLTLDGAKVPAGPARVITLSGNGNDVNDLDNPERVAPVESTIQVNGPAIRLTLKPTSLTILRVKAR